MICIVMNSHKLIYFKVVWTQENKNENSPCFILKHWNVIYTCDSPAVLRRHCAMYVRYGSHRFEHIREVSKTNMRGEKRCVWFRELIHSVWGSDPEFPSQVIVSAQDACRNVPPVFSGSECLVSQMGMRVKKKTKSCSKRLNNKQSCPSKLNRLLYIL